MERRLEAASPEAPVLIVRAGDFFGPRVRASWFAQAMIKPGRPVRRVVNLNRGVGHAWAYLPDLACAMARLRDLGHADPLAAAPLRARGLRGLLGRGRPPDAGPGGRCPGDGPSARARLPWWLLGALSPFGGFPREAVDILPVWRHPVRLDNARLVELLGAEPRTSPVQAMRATLEGLGCLPTVEPQHTQAKATA
jgi:nucleoside-diphosphate-sugar epimerase